MSTSPSMARTRSSVPRSSSLRPSSMSTARSRMVTGILRLRSTLTERMSLVDVSNSSQAPRFGDQLRIGEAAAGRRVAGLGEVDAGRAHQLRDDDALGAVDDEGALLRHQRKIAQEQLLLLDLPGLLHGQRGVDQQPGGIGGVALAALALREAGLLEAVVRELQTHARAREVLDRRDLVEELAQALPQEAVEGPAGHLNQVRHVQHRACLAVVLRSEGRVRRLPIGRGQGVTPPTIHRG